MHTDTVEEGHVVLGGTVTYVVGDRQTVAEGPYIARVPAGVAHTFINSGTEPVNVIATFSQQEARLHRSGAESTLDHSILIRALDLAKQGAYAIAPLSENRIVIGL